MVLTMAVAACGFTAMTLMDFLDLPTTLEESTKLVTTSVILCAFLSVGMENERC